MIKLLKLPCLLTRKQSAIRVLNNTNLSLYSIFFGQKWRGTNVFLIDMVPRHVCKMAYNMGISILVMSILL